MAVFQNLQQISVQWPCHSSLPSYSGAVESTVPAGGGTPACGRFGSYDVPVGKSVDGWLPVHPGESTQWCSE